MGHKNSVYSLQPTSINQNLVCKIGHTESKWLHQLVQSTCKI